MNTRVFQTDLSCESCVTTVKPFLDGEPSVVNWQIDTEDELKTLTVSGPNIDEERIRTLLQSAGYHLVRELKDFQTGKTKAKSAESALKTYAPLLLILAYLLVTLALTHPAHFMAGFMGGFFLIFSFFKLLNLRGFVDAYQTYDLIAAKSRAYAYTYPFIELFLGLGYISGFAPRFIDSATAVLMGVSSLGVIRSLRRSQTIQCACLGTVFKLPMSKVTLFEDFLMTALAIVSLVQSFI